MKKVYTFLFAMGFIGAMAASQPAWGVEPCGEKTATNTIAKQRASWGTIVNIQLHEKKELKIFNKEECTLFDTENVQTKNTDRRVFFRVRNMWQEPGSTASPEIIVAYKVASQRLKIKIYTLTNTQQIQLLTQKTIHTKHGSTKIKAQQKQITINNKKWKVVDFGGTPTIARVKNSVSFLSIGDEGVYGEDKNAVAESMSAIAQQINGIEMVTANGDNFYEPHTISTTDDIDWVDNFLTPYTKAELDVPFYIALGNHEYDDNNLDAILDFNDDTEKWTLPGAYYSVQYPAHSEHPLLEYIVLDTTAIDRQLEGYEEQLQWLDDTLQQSTATWKIVAGHHPIYSYGEHGNTDSLIENVQPLLQEYNVNIYVSGHDHDQQLIQKTNDPTLYVVSGTGSTVRGTAEGTDSLYSSNNLGFAAFQLLQSTAHIQFYTTNAEKQFDYTLTQ